MASPPFHVEDQTDEDFFNKLVDDEFDCTKSGPSFVDGSGSDVANAFSNLSIGEAGLSSVDSGLGDVVFEVDREMGCGDRVVSYSLNAHEGTFLAKESNPLTPNNVVESSNAVTEAEGALDSAFIGNNSVNSGTLGSALIDNSATSGTGVKEVDWTSFNSEAHFHSSSGFGSYSDFFSELRVSSEDPFSKASNTVNLGAEFKNVESVLENPVVDMNLLSSMQNEGQYYGANTIHTVDGRDLSSSQYWEDKYPGWRYDPNTGEYHQLGGYDANVNVQESSHVNAQSAGDDIVLDQRTDTNYLQQTAQSVAGSVSDGATTASVSSWNHVSQVNAEYPAHMVFDPQYPGWYYDMIAQKWELLESYTSAANQQTSVDHNHTHQNVNVSQGDFFFQNNYIFNEREQVEKYGSQKVEKYGSQGLSSGHHVVDRAGPVNNQQNMKTWQPESVIQKEVIGFTENQQAGNLYSSSGHANHSTYQQPGFKPLGIVSSHEQTSRSFDGSNGVIGFQNSIPSENYSQHHNQSKNQSSQQMQFSPAYFDSKESVNCLSQSLQCGTQFSYPSERSSAGRPPHALVTFGFGGKLLLLKDNCSPYTNSGYRSQDSVGVVNVFNLMEVVMDRTDASSSGLGARDYFHTLCQQSFPGPLVGGNVGTRELNKWIDDKITNCECPNMDYRKGEVLRLLFSLLKIACQFYGKLRSPFGSDQALKESDCPESAVAKLFALAKRNGAQPSGYGALSHCLQNLLPEGQIQVTALEVQKFLVSGRKQEALQCAQEGQLWGPALVLASQLGDQFYGDTVKQMALQQLVAGSPLRTLCLLIAGQPANVFSDITTGSSLSGAVSISQQPVQISSHCMLNEWEENLAIITANRTKDDELVIIHLGDCLWKERGEVTAAHLCYLVAEANFEAYSDSARLCLIGADHWKFPRTYVTPEAIQRTELYEYSKVLGNSQFILLPFQPYKLIYAHMLAEVGKVSDALKYCQAIIKSLKTGHPPEVDTWKQLILSLEERIRIHQQGGYSTNLGPTKFVGKLLDFFDSAAHRVVGGLPPPVPTSSHSNIQHHEPNNQLEVPRVPNSQSTMAMPLLIPSASMEPISDWTGGSNRTTVPNRSISEPDFGKTPKKESKDGNSSGTQGKAMGGGSSRIGRIGSQLFQKTVGLVLRSRPDRQAKLGEENLFYYDDKLKRWVERGVEPQAEDTALPPPPTTATFGNGMPDDNRKDASNESLHTKGGADFKSPGPERNPGIPPIPPSSNQFSARGRMGIHSRYVDTFNKGTSATTFQSPVIPPAKVGGGGSNPKFFIPTLVTSTPATLAGETVQTTGERIQEAASLTTENLPPMSSNDDSFSALPPSSMTMQPPPSSSSTMMQRFPSMDNIVHRRMGGMEQGNPSNSRRTVSWSGGLSNVNNPSNSLFMHRDSPPMLFSMGGGGGGGFGEDLHEVEL